MGFNEAGAVMPRKVASSSRSVGLSASASMRPGLLCPGREDARAVVVRAGAASMRPGLLCPGRHHRPGAPQSAGAGFNEAGAVMPRKARRAWRTGTGQGRASMRPGLLCPGRPEIVASHGERRRPASMRPGLLCPGRASCRPAWTPARGRFNEAGAVMPRKAVMPFVEANETSSLQ